MDPYIDNRGKEVPELLDCSGIRHIIRGLTYKGPSGELRPYDLYLPEQHNSQTPLIVSIDGGGWYFGIPSSKHLGSMVRAALDRGYAFASLAMTSCRDRKFPYQLNEAACALSHLKSVSADYGYDGTQVILSGASAGGHMALLAGLTDRFVPEGLDMPEVAALAVFYPVSWLGFTVDDFTAIGLKPRYSRTGPDVMDSIFIGACVERNPGLAAEASPINYLHPHMPALYLMHGKRDSVVPYTQSVELYKRYRQLSPESPARLILIDDAEHDYKRFKDYEGCLRLFDFLDMIVLK